MREVVDRRAVAVSSAWAELLRLHRVHVWHPCGPMPGVSEPLPVVSARGVRLRLADGRELVDGMASWWCAIHGYGHPALDAAVRDQLGRVAHVMFGGLTHEPAVRLAERLVGMAPEGLEHVRVLGAIGVIQLAHPVDVAEATRAAVGHGVWLRPFRDLIYAMPPYVTDDEELAMIAEAMVAAAAAGRGM